MGYKPLKRYLRYFRGTHWRSSLSHRLIAFYTWMNRVTHCLYAAQCRSRGIREWLKRLFCGHVLHRLNWSKKASTLLASHGPILRPSRFPDLMTNHCEIRSIIYKWMRSSEKHHLAPRAGDSQSNKPGSSLQKEKQVFKLISAANGS